jgi:hypothetical protein
MGDAAAEEMEIMRREWALVDTKDPESLKRWFARHQYLTINDHAQIADVLPRAIHSYKLLAGLTKRGAGPTPPKNRKPKPVVAIEVPEDWRTNKTWLQYATSTYGIRATARAVGRNRAIVETAMKRLQVTVNHAVPPTRNPHHNYDWVHRHYVTLGYSANKCSKLAGVHVSTFISWLSHFKIKVRTNEQKRRQKLYFWHRRFVAELLKQPIVSKVRQQVGSIHVRFYSYFWENYYTDKPPKRPKRPYIYFKVTSESTRIKRVPPVHYEYGTDMEGKPYYPAHIAISRADFNKATFIEQRLAIHTFMREIVMRGWIWPSYPPEELAKDLEAIRNANPAKYMENGGFTAIPKPGPRNPPGRKLMLHYFDTSIYWLSISHPRVLVRYMNRMAKRQCDINFLNLLLRVGANENSIWKYRIPPRLPDPVCYHTLYKRLGFTGTILDVSCGFGNKAIAAAAAGLKYTTPDPTFQAALDHGIEDILDYEPDVGQPVDVVIYDESWKVPDMQKVLPYIERGKRLFVFCPHQHQDIVLQYKPKSAIRFRTTFYNKTPNLLFYW